MNFGPPVGNTSHMDSPSQVTGTEVVGFAFQLENEWEMEDGGILLTKAEVSGSLITQLPDRLDMIFPRFGGQEDKVIL